MQNADLGRMTKRLVNDAIAFGQSNQCRDLLFAGISIQIKVQSNLLKTNGYIFGYAECAAKIEIALGSDRSVAQWNAQRGGDCA